MKFSKKLIAVLLSLTMICGLVSIAFAVSAALPSSENLPVSYELYDYFEDINTAMSDKSALSSDSPWSVVMKVDGSWTAADTFSGAVERGWVYAYISQKAWGYYPGFAYNKTASGDRLYLSMLAPTNSAQDNDGIWNIAAAYQFTAPYSGKYTLDKANQDKVLSFDDTNYFRQYNTDDKLDFGVRITVNNTAVWPAEDASYYDNGWAVFGNRNASVDKIEVPTIVDMELTKGDILRVEVKNITPTNTAYSQRVTGMVSVKLTELSDNPDPEPEPEPEPEQAKKYELYDYFYDVQSSAASGQIVSDSPWSVQCYFNDKWNIPDTLTQDAAYYYANCTDRNEWGIGYPGYAFYYNPNITRNELSLIIPTNSLYDPDYVCNSAYVFTSEEDGTYTLHYSDADRASSFDDTQYFAPQYQQYTGIKFGVRITLNNNAIWPTASVYSGTVEDGYAVFGYDISGIPGKVAVPRLSNLKLRNGDVLRVEFTSFTPISDNPWYQCIKGCLSMEKTSSDITPDTEAPKFESGNIELSASGDSYLSFNWPSASDNENADGDLSYILYAAKTPFTQGVYPTADNGVSVSSTGGSAVGLDGDNDYYVALVVSDTSGNKSMLTAGPFRTLIAKSEGLETFEVYDYLDEISAKVTYANQGIMFGETESPWKAQINDNGTWKNLTRATRLQDWIYVNIPNPEWGGYYPGMSFYAPLKSTVNRYFCRLNPTKAAASVNANFDYTSAYAFTAPYAGVYTFDKANTSYAFSEHYSENFALADSGALNQTVGIRITLNGETIWPTANDSCEQQDGYAVVYKYGDPTDSVAIPTIEDISMISGDVLRVEAKAFDGTADSPWTQQVSSCVRMILQEKTVDNEAPIFADGNIDATAKTATSLTFTWPLATDALSNSDSLVYRLYYDTKAISQESISELEAILVSGSSQRLTALESGTDYYVAITVSDIAGNTAFLSNGPFKTSGTSSNDNIQNTETPVPDAPLSSNMNESESGVVSSSSGVVTVGWTPTGTMSYYKVYLFSKSGDSYSLEQSSDILSGNTKSYTFRGLLDKNYVVQVVGYNNRAEAFDIYAPITVANPQSGALIQGGATSNSNSNSTSNSGGVITTIIDNEGITQVQDLYETTTNTRTVTNGPSVLEQVLWVALLIFGGVMVAVSGFLLFLLLRKPKKTV